MKIGRKYKIFLQTNDGDILAVEPPTTIQFNVVRNTLAQANKLSLQIYDLSPSTRSRIFQDRYIQRRYLNIVFMAGYNELTPIFSGNIFSCYSYREQGSPNIITYIEALDGGWDFMNTISMLTFAKNTANIDIVKSLAKNFQYIQTGKIGDIPGYIKRGETLAGTTFDLLKGKTKEKFFVDFEKLNVLGMNEALAGEVPLINSDTGLLGTPRREDTYLSVNTLFEPRITVGQVVEIGSSVQKEFDGQFKVVGVSHSGVISEAVGGECISAFSLLMGNQLTGVINNGVQGFNIINNNNTSVNDVYNYLVKYKQPPTTHITPSIKWSDMLVNYSQQGQTPTKKVLLNLVQTAYRVQEAKDRHFPSKSLKAVSGWRSASHNATLPGAAPNSYHIDGKALDCQIIGYTPTEAQRVLNPFWNGGLEYATTHTHLDIGPMRRFGADV